MAVMHANKVVASSSAARAQGVRRGLRKRDAQSRCSRLIVVEHDPGRDMRAYEPVVAAVEQLAAGVAVLRPGVCAFAARGPARYFGGEAAAAEKLVDQVANECGVEAQIGVADGAFAALLAARAGKLIGEEETAEFLAGLSVSTLERPELADLLWRLGVRTLGDFAALPPGDVLARFGLDAALAQRLAAGRDDRPLAVRQPPPDLDVQERFAEPVERVDMAAFAARALAERLHEKLTGYGLVCTRLAIVAITADGQELERVWRHDGVLTAQAIADRTRWQLEGWLTSRKLACGIIALQLIPEGVLAQVGLQPGLWGEAGAERDRAHRAMHRVQGMLGPESVVTAVLGGGRDPLLQATMVAWGDERKPALAQGPWPGRLPPPSPAVVAQQEQPVEVISEAGEQVRVDARLALNADPGFVVMGRSKVEIVAWSGPWPVDERWWVVEQRPHRLVRLQVLLANGQALLLILSGGEWSIPAEFD
ncbi:DNA polymerase [Rhizocola hellebori]|uniref:DNA polymerase n=1 Tax=Rhizocola hellebori TaxID=1392758 RepID=A0A8J3VEI7_9ACTN|nr:DNA polymerase [Rhizocola hellebori]